jgi:hypothetical protein
MTPCFSGFFNDIAWQVMAEMNVLVMDAYWLTLSRPDHRETLHDNILGARLAHAGPEVYSVLVRKWAMMILEVLLRKNT